MDCHGLRDAMKKNMPKFEGRGRAQGFSGRKRVFLFSMGQAGEAKAAFKQRPEGREGGRQQLDRVAAAMCSDSGSAGAEALRAMCTGCGEGAARVPVRLQLSEQGAE